MFPCTRMLGRFLPSANSEPTSRNNPVTPALAGLAGFGINPFVIPVQTGIQLEGWKVSAF